MQATIKKEFLDKRLAFGRSGNTLSNRSGEEINDLAIMALESKDQSLLKLFDKLPSLADLKKVKTDNQLKRVAVVAVKNGK